MIKIIIYTTAGAPSEPDTVELSATCTVITVSWAKSDGALSYIVNVTCGANIVVRDIETNGTKLERQYGGEESHCLASVFAVNPAGSSRVVENSTSIAKGESQE